MATPKQEKRQGVVVNVVTCFLLLAVILSRPAFSQDSNVRQKDASGAQPARGETSYMPVALTRPFEEIHEEMSAKKDNVMQRQIDLLEARYDLSDRPVDGVAMSRGKPVQGGVRVKLPEGVT